MTKRFTKAFRNANVRLPETLTKELIEDLLQLNCDAPKTRYMKECLLEKFVSKDTAPYIVRRTRAINKWLATERDNEATNDRLLTTHPDYQILPGVEFSRFVEKAAEVIERIVGPVPDYDSIIGSFSGGASTSKNRTQSYPALKYLGQADITEDCLPLFLDMIVEMEGWHQFKDDLELRVVPGNVMFTVPKNADIDRVACKEPDINMFIQKGLGSAIRRALRPERIDLNDQSINQRLARTGSIDGSLATLDLSSASDSISYGLVEALMPSVWFSWLNASRSSLTDINGELHRNEMFSSMGNGFTFELESLLFYALARTTAYFEGIKGIISVYGDDIIVPTHLSQSLIWVLSYFGFTVNTKKSFWEGPFRESCGGHFINGFDITPFYLREPIGRLTDLIHVLNALRKWSETMIGINDPVTYPIWEKYAALVPKKFWGGREYSSITQLVSPHQARQVLVPVKVDLEMGVGAYVHWLNSTWRRKTAGDPVMTSVVTKEIPFYRGRGCRDTGTQLWHVFLEEICAVPSS